MVNLEIHSAKYRLKDQWKEITLAEAIEIYKIAKKLPSYWISLYEEKLKEEPDQKRIQDLANKITIEDLEKNLPIIYGEMIMVLSDIPADVLKKVHSGDRRALYEQYLSHLVLGLLFWPAYKSQGISSFKHKGTTYYLPTASKLHGYEKPGADLTALEFTEVADLQIAAAHLEEGRFAHASKIIAILCRPKGEAYDETTCGNRAEGFMSLTMDKVWEVFFSLLESTVIFQQHSLLSTLQAELLALLSGSKSKPTAGMPALSKSRRRALWGVSKKLKKRTPTTS